MKFIPIPIILLLLAFILSCNEDEFGKTWVYIEETQCANPWDGLGSGSTENNVTEYLKKHKIRVYDVKVTVYSPGPSCNACFCPSGRVILVLIRLKDIKKIKNLGFEEGNSP